MRAGFRNHDPGLGAEMTSEMRPLGLASKQLVEGLKAAGARRLRAHRRRHLRAAVPDGHHEAEGHRGAHNASVPLGEA